MFGDPKICKKYVKMRFRLGLCPGPRLGSSRRFHIPPSRPAGTETPLLRPNPTPRLGSRAFGASILVPPVQAWFPSAALGLATALQ